MEELLDMWVKADQIKMDLEIDLGFLFNNANNISTTTDHTYSSKNNKFINNCGVTEQKNIMMTKSININDSNINSIYSNNKKNNYNKDENCTNAKKHIDTNNDTTTTNMLLDKSKLLRKRNKNIKNLSIDPNLIFDRDSQLGIYYNNNDNVANNDMKKTKTTTTKTTITTNNTLNKKKTKNIKNLSVNTNLAFNESLLTTPEIQLNKEEPYVNGIRFHRLCGIESQIAYDLYPKIRSNQYDVLFFSYPKHYKMMLPPPPPKLILKRNENSSCNEQQDDDDVNHDKKRKKK